MLYQPLATFIFLASSVFRIAGACSSRSTPKPRPPSQNPRPNITFPTYECPKEYRSHYCLNNARCFTVKIENSVLYNCECTDGFTGPRCEFKDPDGSYLLSREKVLIETASIAGGLVVAVLLIFIISVVIYVYVRRRNIIKTMSCETTHGTDGGQWSPFRTRRPQHMCMNVFPKRRDDVESGGTCASAPASTPHSHLPLDPRIRTELVHK